jgi:NADH-quinone oxidoreductase subunit K
MFRLPPVAFGDPDNELSGPPRKGRSFLVMDITLNHFLAVAAVLFAIGLMGVVMRRNLLIIYMSLEMMLQAANLTFVAFARFNNHADGQVFVFFVITVAAAEVAVGLALIVALYRLKRTTQVGDLNTLKF